MIRRLPPVHSPIAPSAILRELARPPGLRRGDPLARLRRLLADRYEADAVILTGSGTQALQLALTLAREVTGRRRALLPAYTCYDIVSAAVGARVETGFYDIQPDLLLPEPDTLAAALGPDTGAVVVVHHYGIPTPVEPVNDLAGSFGALVIEDAAQAHGGFLGARPLGALAPLSVLSFGRGKGWTGGGGGALLLRGDMASHGREVESTLDPPGSGRGAAVKLAGQWLLGRPALYALPAALPWLDLGATRYVPPTMPTAMAESVAGMVLRHDQASLAEARARAANAEALRTRLVGAADLVLPPDRGQPGWLRYPLRAPGRGAERVLGERGARLGLMPGYPRPLPTLEALRADTGSDTPGATALTTELFTAPTHRWVGAGDLDRIAALVANTA